MRRLLNLSLVLGAMAIALCAPTFGQSNYGVVTGTVMDEQRLPVAGATIQLTAASTGATRRVVTNQQGLFEVPALLPDDYEVKSEASGFALATQSVRLEVGQRLAIVIALRLGSIQQGVEVHGGAEVLQTTDASVG